MKIIRIVVIYCISFIVLPGMGNVQKDTVKKQQIRQVEIVTFKPGTSEANQHMVDNSFRKIANKLPLVIT